MVVVVVFFFVIIVTISFIEKWYYLYLIGYIQNKMQVSRAEVYIQSFSATDPNGVYLMTLLTHGVLPRWPIIIFCEFVDDSIIAQLKEVDDTIIIYRITGLTSTLQWINKVQDVVPRIFRPGRPRLVIGCGWNVHRIMNYYDVGGDEPLWIIADEECDSIVEYFGKRPLLQPSLSAPMAMSELLSLKTTIQSVNHIVFASSQIRDVFYMTLLDGASNADSTSGSSNPDIVRRQQVHVSDMIALHRNHIVLPRGVTAMDSLEEMATCAIQLDLDIVCSMSPLQCRYNPRYHQTSTSSIEPSVSAAAATSSMPHETLSLSLSQSLSASTLERNLGAVDISLNQINNKSLIVLLLQQSQTLQRDVFNLVSRDNTIRHLRQKVIRIVRPILLVDLDNTIANFSECFDQQFTLRHPNTAVIQRDVYTLVDRIANTPAPSQPPPPTTTPSSSSENMDASFVLVNNADNSVVSNDSANTSSAKSTAFTPPQLMQQQQRPTTTPYNKLPTEWHGQQVKEILSSPNFFLNLEPLPGAITTLNELEQMGFQIMFCSMSSPDSFASASEKGEWIMRYFPHKQWHRDLILTGCKHLVQGDILVDDLYVVQNEKKHLAHQAATMAKSRTCSSLQSSTSSSSSLLMHQPAWNQIVFAQAYNNNQSQQSTSGAPRMLTTHVRSSTASSNYCMSGHESSSSSSSAMEYDNLPRIDMWNSMAIQTIIDTFFYRLPSSVKAACEIRFRNMADVMMQKKQDNHSHLSTNVKPHSPSGKMISGTATPKTIDMSSGKSGSTPDEHDSQHNNLGAAARAAITSLAILPGKTTPFPQ